MITDEFELLSGLKKGRLVGSGVYGDVYEIKGKSGIVVKEQKVPHHNKELSFLKMFSRKNISPKLYGAYRGKEYGYLVMEKYTGKLGNILNGPVRNLPGMTKDGNFNAKTRKKLRDIIKKMHKTGVLHMNLHVDNILYKLTPKGIKFRIIDPGLAVQTSKSLKTPKQIENAINHEWIGKNRHKDLTVRRELQFYKGYPPPKEDIQPSRRDLKVFKGI